MSVRSSATLLFCMLTASTLLAQSPEDQLKSIRARLEARLVEEPPAADRVEELVTKLGEDGRWPDIDYKDQNRASWAVMASLDRTQHIAAAYRAPGHALQGDKRLSRAVNRVLADWAKHRYRNPNWWFGSIGVPSVIGRICILMEKDIKPETLKIIKGYVARTRPKGKGQNLIWISECVMYGGILRGEHATVKTAANYIKSSIRQGVYPGVQTDWSYHHHGPQNQLGVYGSAFAQDMARYAHLFKDTDCALSSEQLAILGGFLTEGVGWVVWKGAIDANCIGRTVSRKGVTSRFDYLFSTYKLMSEVGPEYKTPCLDYIKRNSSGGTNNLIGNKHFWQSDLMVHRAKTWYASARMSSNRTIGVESSNRENLRGYFAADGVLLLYVTGREYEEIFPVWDWRRLPGITCLQAGDPPPMPRRLQGTTDFVGGVSDGKTGISVLEYDRCALSAQKAWFFLDDAVVCMGAGIRSDEAHPVATSVNQCLLQGDVVEDADRYWHGSIGYHFPSRQKVTCRRGPQSGSWSQLTEATVDPATDKVEKDVFSLSIDHGATPKSATYLYVIYPGIAADELQSKAEEEKIVLVSNNTDIQGIYDKSKKRHMVAFWEAGSIQLNNKRTLKVDSPCLLMLGDTGGAAVLFISDPTQKLEAVTVELTGFKPLSIQLPAAPCRGDSLETHLSPL